MEGSGASCAGIWICFSGCHNVSCPHQVSRLFSNSSTNYTTPATTHRTASLSIGFATLWSYGVPSLDESHEPCVGSCSPVLRAVKRTGGGEPKLCSPLTPQIVEGGRKASVRAPARSTVPAMQRINMATTSHRGREFLLRRGAETCDHS